MTDLLGQPVTAAAAAQRRITATAGGDDHPAGPDDPAVSGFDAVAPVLPDDPSGAAAGDQPDAALPALILQRAQHVAGSLRNRKNMKSVRRPGRYAAGGKPAAQCFRRQKTQRRQQKTPLPAETFRQCLRRQPVGQIAFARSGGQQFPADGRQLLQYGHPVVPGRLAGRHQTGRPGADDDDIRTIIPH